MLQGSVQGMFPAQLKSKKKKKSNIEYWGEEEEKQNVGKSPFFQKFMQKIMVILLLNSSYELSTQWNFFSTLLQSFHNQFI